MCMELKKCVVCGKEIHPERLAMHSGLVTCSKLCSQRHRAIQIKQAARRYYHRKKAERQLESSDG